MANGLLIYKEQGFHTDQQAKVAEYVAADVIPQMVTVTLKTGKKLDVPAGKSPVVIPFAKDSTDEPKTVIKRIDASIARFPQFKTQLEIIKKDWTAKMQPPAEPQPSDNTLPSSSAPNTPPSENAFRDGVVTSVYPDGVTVSSSSSLTKIRFADMTPEEKARFNYDPIKEKEYLDGLEKARKASIEQKKLADEQEARESKARHKTFLKDQLSATNTIKAVESDLPGYLDKYVTVQGTIELSDYYNYLFRDLQADLLCFKIVDDTGSGWVYMKRGQDATSLRSMIISNKEPVKGRFTFIIPHELYETGQSGVQGLLQGVERAIVVDE